jgi:hypothetical protein
MLAVSLKFAVAISSGVVVLVADGFGDGVSVVVGIIAVGEVTWEGITTVFPLQP